MTPEQRVALRAACQPKPVCCGDWSYDATDLDGQPVCCGMPVPEDDPIKRGALEALDEIERLGRKLAEVQCRPLHGSCDLPRGHAGEHWPEGCHGGRVPRPDAALGKDGGQ